MNRRRRLATIIGLALACTTISTWNDAIAQKRGTEEPLPVVVSEGIRAVYQINTDNWKEGVGKGLLYLEKLSTVYQEMGINSKDRTISAVFHGEAAYWLLNDEAYGEFKDSKSDNPNKNIVAGLIEKGISIEICAETMKSHGWKPEDLLPQVRMVVGAYPRVIDLQLRGYAYIRF